VDARLWRRHAHYPEKRRQRHLAPERPADPVRELPLERMAATAVVDAPRPWFDRVDLHHQRLADARAADGDGAGQRVSGVDLACRLEVLARPDIPVVVRHGEANRVARLDLEHRLELGREVPVQVAPLERQLMQRH